MNGFIEVTDQGVKVLLNTRYIISLSVDEDGATLLVIDKAIGDGLYCLTPSESYTEVVELISSCR